MRISTALAIAALLPASACEAGDRDLTKIALQDGRTVGEVVGSRPAAVLVMDPADAFTCVNALSMWLDWERGGDNSFVLLFSRRPTVSEQRQLKLFRVHADGTLARRRRVGDGGSAREYYVHDGRVTYTARFHPSRLSSPLLARAVSGRLGELVPPDARAASVAGVAR